ncbi:M3 family metallopeptidase [Streptomyces sp. NPDC050485]|uniref:M3 family metallopeptidase n=1 Tax=Streptomyces sp. NPDC050485 TaxID=3365617 RepID=UPI0037BDC4EF
MLDERAARQDSGGGQGAAADALPRWSLTSIFPGLDSKEFARARASAIADLPLLKSAYRGHGVGPGARLKVDEKSLATFDSVMEQSNDLFDRYRTISFYLSALVWSDETDEAARQQQLEFRTHTRELLALVEDLKSWAARFDGEELLAGSQVARKHAYFVERAAATTRHRMPVAAEALYHRLQEFSGAAWFRLYQELAGGVGPYPLKYEPGGQPEGAVERHEGNVTRWRSVAGPLTASLNAIKGEELLIAQARGWDSPLSERVDTEGIDQDILQAMIGAVRDVLPQVRSFLSAKARLLGRGKALPWWDIPVPVLGDRRVPWPEAVPLVERAFAGHSRELAGLPRQALKRQWVDSQPRDTKRSRDLCVMVADGEPRILITYDGTYESILSWAHELGHAYHYLQLTGTTWLQRDIPLTISETASGFCEALVGPEILRSSPDDERLARLNAVLVRKCQNTVDSLVTFSFEDNLFRERMAGPLTEDRICDLMTDSQLSAYQDSVVPHTLHRYWWAARADTFGSPYASWQYCFGNLLGAALAADAEHSATDRRRILDEILRRSGESRLDTIMREAGVDLRKSDFWAAGLATFQDQIAEFITTVEENLS